MSSLGFVFCAEHSNNGRERKKRKKEAKIAMTMTSYRNTNEMNALSKSRSNQTLQLQ
jgi:hypothetical protein